MRVVTLSLIFSLLAHRGKASNCPAPNIDGATFAKKKFDYLIVGGGTAGLAVAARLSENENLQIGVIEAGSYHQNDPLVDTPEKAMQTWGNPDYDWEFVTTPQPGANGAQIATTRGKMLGGSSGVNLMAWTRASSDEYNAWSTFAPDTDWSWAGLLPYLQKCEAVDRNLTNPYPGISSSDEFQAILEAPLFEGFNGPIKASYNTWYSDVTPPWVSAHNSIGIQTNPDPDNGNTCGIRNGRFAIDRTLGVRSYSASGYYCQSASRNNLYVLTGAQATKINLSSSSSLSAIGVTYISSSDTYTANATKEIILSAGSIGTPQLLELSGIGNATLLKSLGIQPLIDLPGVGENLQEQMYAPVQFQLKDGFHTFDELRNNATFAAEQQAQYDTNHSGLLAATSSAITYLPFQDFLNATEVAAQITLFDSSVSAMGTLTPLQKAQYSIQRSFLTAGKVPQIELIQLVQGLAPSPNTSYTSVLAGGQRPLARGTVHINTTVATAPPVINGNYLNNDFDTHTVLQALKLGIRLGQTTPISNDIEALTLPPPGLNDDELISFLRSAISTGSHILGTAAMAPKNMGGVVNPSMVVYGTSNLRVVDCSTIPLQLSTHTEQTVLAIAEKASDIIKGARP